MARRRITSTPTNPDRLDPLGEAFDAEVTVYNPPPQGPPVDPPERKRVFLDAVAYDDGKTFAPIVPPAMRPATLPKTAAAAVKRGGYYATFHTLRSPKYLTKTMLWAPVGVFRGIGRILHWAFDLEGHTIRQYTATRNDVKGYLELSRVRDRRVGPRVRILVAALAPLIVGVVLLLTVAPHWWRWPALALALVASAIIGRPIDKPITDRVVVGERFVKLTALMCRAALMAALPEKVKEPGAVTFPRDIYRDHPGWTAIIQLPPGVVVTDVLDRRDRLAGGFRLPESQVWPAAVDGAHPGMLRIWVADVPVANMRQPAWPLLRGGHADYFRAFPVGFDERMNPVKWSLDQKNSLFGGMPGSGKAVALDTPVPTPTGWKTMGDLRAGDEVYDESGQPCRVADAWPVRYDRPCYEVKFSDGSRIIADAEHLWLTWDVNTRKAYDYANPGASCYPDDWATWSPGRSSVRPYMAGERDQMRALRQAGLTAREVGAQFGRSAVAVQQQWCRPEPDSKAIAPRTTEELAATLYVRERHNHAIPAARPLHLPDAELPVDPYVLGYLLGDGDSADGGRVACDPQDRDWLLTEFQAAGYGVSPHADAGHFGVHGIGRTWRALGLSSKHIPPAYQRASVQQRLALAQGLIDSDGCVDSHGAYRFTTTSQALAEGFRELVTTLGCVPQMRTRPGRVRAGNIGRPGWEIIVPTDLPLARLPRKALVARRSWKREQTSRYIVSITPVPSVPVRCITVDSPNHLYLIGEACIPTHNTLAVRTVVLGAITDPSVVPIIFELKGTGEFDDFEPLCPPGFYGSGADEDTKARALASLAWLFDECKRRAPLVSAYAKQGLNRTNNVNRAMVDKDVRLRPIVAVYDEVQELFTDREHGKAAVGMATSLVKLGRALGIHIMWSTQRIDKESVPRGISSNIANRACLAVPSHVETDLVLGTGAYAQGARPTKFETATDEHPKDSGWCWRAGTGQMAPFRFAYVDNEWCRTVVARVIAERTKLGIMPSPEDGEDLTFRDPLADVRDVFRAGEAWVSWQQIADRLAEEQPAAYRDVTKETISAQLRALGVESASGRRGDQVLRGAKLEHIDAAIETRQIGGAA